MKKMVHISMLISLLYFQEYSCLASNPRGHYNYELKDSHKVVYRGTTNNPRRREGEHVRNGKEFTHMVIKGNSKTWKGARKEEKRSLKTYRKNHQGKNPKYNKTNHG